MLRRQVRGGNGIQVDGYLLGRWCWRDLVTVEGRGARLRRGPQLGDRPRVV